MNASTPRLEATPLRLLPGTDLRRALEDALAPRDCAAAFVISGIGSLSRAAVRFAGAKAAQVISGEFEIQQEQHFDRRSHSASVGYVAALHVTARIGHAGVQVRAVAGYAACEREAPRLDVHARAGYRHRLRGTHDPRRKLMRVTARPVGTRDRSRPDR
jgi:hypothetical protein